MRDLKTEPECLDLKLGSLKLIHIGVAWDWNHRDRNIRCHYSQIWHFFVSWRQVYRFCMGKPFCDNPYSCLNFKKTEENVFKQFYACIYNDLYATWISFQCFTKLAFYVAFKSLFFLFFASKFSLEVWYLYSFSTWCRLLVLNFAYCGSTSFRI